MRQILAGSAWGHCCPSLFCWELPRGRGAQPAPAFCSAPEGLAAGESAVRPSWGLHSAWLLPFLVCAGAREETPHHSRAQPLPCSQPRHRCRAHKGIE